MQEKMETLNKKKSVRKSSFDWAEKVKKEATIVESSEDHVSRKRIRLIRWRRRGGRWMGKFPFERFGEVREELRAVRSIRPQALPRSARRCAPCKPGRD